MPLKTKSKRKPEYKPHLYIKPQGGVGGGLLGEGGGESRLVIRNLTYLYMCP